MNVFSPNGDNVNDEWVVHITNPNVTVVKCSVFDRWGDLVFLTADSPIVWDGKYGEKELNPAVYVYVLQLEMQNGETRVESGSVTLMR
ncbi:MAG TPA: gliding motility-associated C-terminal domain-containing protein [Saprospiraceae bacterium]|nr:gliding motility-associated C-terminal domain-containing protein [Saprospiraceae bacterium]